MITIVHFHPLPSFPSIAPLIKPNVLVTPHHERVIEERRSSRRTNRTKNPIFAEFRKLINAQIRVEIYGRILDWTVDITTAELNQFNFNFVLLSQLHREHFDAILYSVIQNKIQLHVNATLAKKQFSHTFFLYVLLQILLFNFYFFISIFITYRYSYISLYFFIFILYRLFFSFSCTFTFLYLRWNLYSCLYLSDLISRRNLIHIPR